MNICIESSLLNHHQRSGLLTYAEGLINSLYRADQNNHYTLAYYSLSKNSTQMPGPGGKNFRKAVLKIPDRPFWGRQSLLDNLALPLFFKKNKTRVFHRLSGYTMPNSKDVFKVLTVHDLRTLTIGDTFRKQNIEHYRNTLNKSDVCLAVSKSTKRDMIQHFRMDERKIKVTYLAAAEHFRPATREKITQVMEKYQIREPFLLSIGFVPRKNIDGIIRGFAGADVKKEHLLVLNVDRDIDRYKEIAKESGVLDRIRFLPKLTDEEVVVFYSACTAFLFPSYYEGFGLPILEAMQCGAPVITSNVSSCPEVAGEAAILVDPYKIGEISDAINQICHNRDLRSSLIAKGFERAKLFSWSKFAKEMNEIYSLAKEKR